MNYTHMLIGEAVTNEYVSELVNRMQNHVRNIPELIGHSILAEEGGRMVILVTDWPSRQDCLQYHSSRVYRQVNVDTQDRLVGNYVVKVFQDQTEGELDEPRNPRKDPRTYLL
jgi:heme-degrading monooxygenase HmoA